MKDISIGGYTSVNPDEVVLLVASVNYTIVHLSDGNKTIVATPLKTLETKFLPYLFYRTHKSYLVNLKCIMDFQERQNLLQMSNNQVVVVSRRKRNGLKKWLNDLPLNRIGYR
jgi:DNA-binding LytR/AlgR family response regulator